MCMLRPTYPSFKTKVPLLLFDGGTGFCYSSDAIRPNKLFPMSHRMRVSIIYSITHTHNTHTHTQHSTKANLCSMREFTWLYFYFHCYFCTDLNSISVSLIITGIQSY